MSVEFQITTTGLAPSDTNLLSTDNTVPAPIPPSGNGWRLVHMATSVNRIYYTWQRFSSTIIVDGNYIADNSDEILLVDSTTGNIIISLPAPNISTKITIKKISNDSNTITILPSNTYTIDGQNQLAITTQYYSYTLVGTNTNWFLI